MFPGNAIHILDSIDATQWNAQSAFQDLLHAMFCTENVSTPKLFWIRKLLVNGGQHLAVAMRPSDRRSDVQTVGEKWLIEDVFVQNAESPGGDMEWMIITRTSDSYYYTLVKSRGEGFKTMAAQPFLYYESAEIESNTTTSGVDAFDMLFDKHEGMQLVYYRTLDVLVTKLQYTRFEFQHVFVMQTMILYQSKGHDEVKFYWFAKDFQVDGDRYFFQHTFDEPQYIQGLLSGLAQSTVQPQLAQAPYKGFVTELEKQLLVKRQKQESLSVHDTHDAQLKESSSSSSSSSSGGGNANDEAKRGGVL
jgi:hypothetical protein